MLKSIQYTEEEIIERILAGEKSLYEIIVRRYNPYLYKIGRSYNFGREDTEDLMQDTFVDAFKNLALFEGRSKFKTWISRIMLNNCYHKKEKLSYKNEIMKEIFDNSEPLFHQPDQATQQLVDKRELGQIIEAALLELPYYYRMVFTLREINGLNVSETSELLEISESNVKVRLNRAKSMLKKIISKSYEPEQLYNYNAIYCDPFTKRVMDIIEQL
ncbi:MAG: sigma-70 family RNA polymerase sigma factor [Flavobacteriia bacterium]|nr:sigma-70 family RNA polymerase sigma factor [Flavobacteriia bacterium]